jgi:hypothetical protein
MTSGSGNGHRADEDAELTAQVAELAGEISEAKTASRRKRLAEQLPKLAAGSRARSWSGLQSGNQLLRNTLRAGGDVAKRGFEAGSSAARNATQASSAAARRSAKASGTAARRSAEASGTAARRSAEASRTAAGKGATVGGSVAKAGAHAGGTAWQGVRQGGQWLAGQAIEMAPKVPMRSGSTLREQYQGLGTDELADTLIEGAARASAGVGAAVGAAAALPFLPTAPVEVGVEVLALFGIELKLVAELHEVYGLPAPGSGAQRMTAYVNAWADRRGVRLTAAGLDLAIGTPVRHRLERRILVRAGQSTLSLTPLLTGAAIGAWLDHHETRRLGRRVRDDLRKRAATQPGVS